MAERGATLGTGAVAARGIISSFPGDEQASFFFCHSPTSFLLSEIRSCFFKASCKATTYHQVIESPRKKYCVRILSLLALPKRTPPAHSPRACCFICPARTPPSPSHTIECRRFVCTRILPLEAEPLQHTQILSRATLNTKRSLLSLRSFRRRLPLLTAIYFNLTGPSAHQQNKQPCRSLALTTQHLNSPNKQRTLVSHNSTSPQPKCSTQSSLSAPSPWPAPPCRTPSSPVAPNLLQAHLSPSLQSRPSQQS